MGEPIRRFTNKGEVDEPGLVSLIERAFERPLTQGWWGAIELLSAYVSESYRAAAVVAVLDEFVYLDKFAIDESARGEGLARTVWDHMMSDYPHLVWRSRTDNDINAFYENEADGNVKVGDWVVFWKGIDDFEVIGRAVKRLSEMPAAFGGHADA
jgi:acetylglutamate kinase